MPLREEDLPLLERWLLQPHVREWWDDRPGEAYPDLSEYVEAIRGEDPTDIFVIQADGRPVGMIESYRIDDHPEYAQVLGLGEPAAGFDVFLGEPDMLHRGHGPALLRAFLREVVYARYGTDLCVIGPSNANVSAIRAYEKIGFRHFKNVFVPGERLPEYLMRLRKDDLS